MKSEGLRVKKNLRNQTYNCFPFFIQPSTMFNNSARRDTALSE